MSNGNMTAKDELERTLRRAASDSNHATGMERMRAALALWVITEEMKDTVDVDRLRTIVEGAAG